MRIKAKSCFKLQKEDRLIWSAYHGSTYPSAFYSIYSTISSSNFSFTRYHSCCCYYCCIRTISCAARVLSPPHFRGTFNQCVHSTRSSGLLLSFYSAAANDQARTNRKPPTPPTGEWSTNGGIISYADARTHTHTHTF